MRTPSPQGFSSRRRLLAFGLALSLLPFGAGLWLWRLSQRGITVAKLERSIGVEVPRGCGRQAVEAWFDRRGIVRNWSVDTAGGMSGHQTMRELAGLRDEDLGGLLWGSIDGPEVNVDLVFSGRIDIYFWFDKSGREVGHLLYPFTYEP